MLFKENREGCSHYTAIYSHTCVIITTVCCLFSHLYLFISARMHFTYISAYYPPLIFFKAWNSPFPQRKYFTGIWTAIYSEEETRIYFQKEVDKIFFFFFLNFLNLILPSVRREAAVQITRGFTHPYSSHAKREVILSPRIKQDT